MQNLLLEEGGLVQVESVNLQVATYSKFQPQSPDFLDITNPKAVYPFEIRRVLLNKRGVMLTGKQGVLCLTCAYFREHIFIAIGVVI